MPTPTTTTTKGTGTKTLWEVDCTPECGFMVREHNQKALLAEVGLHCTTVHNKTYSEKEILAMAKRV